jgi:hypothetical protein
MDFMLSQVAQCSSFNPTCDAQMRTGIYLLNAVCLKYDHRQISLRSMHIHCRPIENNKAQFTYATEMISFAIKKSDHIWSKNYSVYQLSKK